MSYNRVVGCCQQAVAKVIEANFPMHLVAALKRYQYFQEKKYNAQQCAAQHKARYKQAMDQDALEAAICIMSKMENANFIGQLFCVEDEVLHELAQYPIQADAFICLALLFQGTITQSPLDPTPNRWHAAPGRCHPHAAFLQCQAGNH